MADSEGRRPTRRAGSQPRRRRERSGPSPTPRRGGAAAGGAGAAALLHGKPARLGLGILFAVILALVIVLVVRDCQRNALENSYTDYLNGVAQIVQRSADQGKELRQVMVNTQGQNPHQLRQSIQSIATEAEGLVDEARNLSPPDALAQPQGSLVTLLQYRVSGLTKLADDLPTLLQADNEDFKAKGIADQMKRFLASDIIYQESFERPAGAAMERDRITGVEVPSLQPFLGSNDTLATAEGAKTLLSGLERTGGGGENGDEPPGEGNLRGTGIAAVEVMPAGLRLDAGTPTTIGPHNQLQWRVTVENSGDFVESGVVVRASFSYSSDPNQPEVQEQSIPAINPGEQVAVTLDGPTNIDWGVEGNLVIEVEPVPGETFTENNTASFQVTIAL